MDPSALDPDKILNVLSKLGDASSAAQKYGPFYFALFLLLIIPFASAPLLKKSVEKEKDTRIRQALLEHYSLYFRICLLIGALCTVVSVAWWLYANYRQEDAIAASLAALKSEVDQMRSKEKEMRYTTIGYIENTTDLKNEFVNTLGRPSIVFSREGGRTNTWMFAVISDQPILPAQPISIILAYTVPTSGEHIYWHIDFPIKASATPLAYRFTVDQDGAHIQLHSQQPSLVVTNTSQQ